MLFVWEWQYMLEVQSNLKFRNCKHLSDKAASTKLIIYIYFVNLYILFRSCSILYARNIVESSNYLYHNYLGYPIVHPWHKGAGVENIFTETKIVRRILVDYAHFADCK